MKVGGLPSGVTSTGVAWLSSARAVRCLVKSFNERNSYFILVTFLILKGPLIKNS